MSIYKDIKIVSENNGPFENEWLIKQSHVTVDGANFLVSSSKAFGAGVETLAFKCSPDGKVDDWVDVAGSWHNGVTLDGNDTLELVKDLFE
jgi:hypothetical protein